MSKFGLDYLTIVLVLNKDNSVISFVHQAPNNIVRYSISAGADDIECFLIDSVTGSLSLRRSLLYAPCTASRYQVR